MRTTLKIAVLLALLLVVAGCNNVVVPAVPASSPDSYYGEGWNKGAHPLSHFEYINLVTTDVYVRTKNLTNGSMNGIHIIDGNMTVPVEGDYLLNAYFILEPVGAGGDYGMKAWVGETGQEQCYSHFKTNSLIEVSTSCIVRMNANDMLTMRFDDHATPVVDLKLYAGNVALVRIGS